MNIQYGIIVRDILELQLQHGSQLSSVANLLQTS